MDRNFISIVVTCYNYGKYLDACLNSIINQGDENTEIILIDDGSTDNTTEIVETYIKGFKVKYNKQENQGQTKSKNRGIRESSGDFIAFLDADDIWLPNKLQKQLALFEDPEVGVVFSRRKWIDENGDEISGNERTLYRGNVLNQIFVDNFICFSSAVIRRSYLEEVGYFDESLPMGIDYDLWIRLAARCKFDYVDEPLVKYRTGHANLSKNTMKRYDCAQKIMKKNLADPAIRSKMSWHVPRLAWADTWSNMASYYARQGDFSSAIKYYSKAILQFPIYPELWKRMVKSSLRGVYGAG